MLKVVLDTNVLVSGIIKHQRGGIPDQILARVSQYELFLSEEILEETERVLHYPRILKKLNLSQHRVADYMLSLRAIATVYSNVPPVAVVRQDPSDDMILACALKAEADVIVSGDVHLLKLKAFQGMAIIKPAEFLQVLDKGIGS